MKASTRIAVIALLGAGMSLGAGSVMAQSGQGGHAGYQMGQSKAASAHYSDQQIQNFAKARNKVRATSQQWQKKVKNAKDRKTAQKYMQQENKALIKAVKDSGLSVQEFNSIARDAQKDKALKKRIQKAQ